MTKGGSSSGAKGHVKRAVLAHSSMTRKTWKLQDIHGQSRLEAEGSPERVEAQDDRRDDQEEGPGQSCRVCRDGAVDESQDGAERL